MLQNLSVLISATVCQVIYIVFVPSLLTLLLYSLDKSLGAFQSMTRESLPCLQLQ